MTKTLLHTCCAPCSVACNPSKPMENRRLRVSENNLDEIFKTVVPNRVSYYDTDNDIV